MSSPDPRTIPGWPANAAALPEKEVAALLGIRSHVLRDLRLRDPSVSFTRIGRRVLYTAEQTSVLLLGRASSRRVEMGIHQDMREGQPTSQPDTNLSNQIKSEDHSTNTKETN